MIDFVLTIDHAIRWHEKNAVMCEEISNESETRYGQETLDRAKRAAEHHKASVAGLRNLVYETKRKIINQHLEATKPDGTDTWEIQTSSGEKP